MPDNQEKVYLLPASCEVIQSGTLNLSLASEMCMDGSRNHGVQSFQQILATMTSQVWLTGLCAMYGDVTSSMCASRMITCLLNHLFHGVSLESKRREGKPRNKLFEK